ncbi:MAG: molybdopterin-dependent oxidoreductase, partial [Anaerolineae bacterium]|nr:molybdopterin-dependent oxidoreductase [Anaerolineae bacterium]
EDLAAEVSEYTAEWAAKETELPADQIHETARLMGKNAPAVCIHPGRHVTWDGNDVQRERAIAILQAILGTWGRKGGVYMATKARVAPIPGPKPFPEPQREALNRGGYPHAGMEGVTNVVRESTITGKPYPIKGWIVTGTNLMAAMPNQPETVAAINNLDLLVAVDVMPTATAMMADVVLPECTYLERHDAITALKGRDLRFATRQPAVEPMYDSKPGWWIARELGLHLGLDEYYPWETYEEQLEEACLVWDLDYEQLREEGVVVIPNTAAPYIGPGNEASFHTYSKKILLYNEELLFSDFDPVPRYKAPEQPGEDQFRLLYGRSPVHTFSRTINNPVLSELDPENEVWVNADKAKRLGLENGDYVRLVNQDGVKSNRIRVKATERIRRDCVFMVHGFGQTAKRLGQAYMKGADDQKLITRYAVDPIAGTTGMRVNFVKLVKEA